MSYRDPSARDRFQRLEAALRDGPPPKRPVRWLTAIMISLVAIAVAFVVWLVHAW